MSHEVDELARVAIEAASDMDAFDLSQDMAGRITGNGVALAAAMSALHSVFPPDEAFAESWLDLVKADTRQFYASRRVAAWLHHRGVGEYPVRHIADDLGLRPKAVLAAFTALARWLETSPGIRIGSVRVKLFRHMPIDRLGKSR